jgi:thiamine-phosphate pyrophosphorylase
LKDLRHTVRRAGQVFLSSPLSYRDSEGDVGGGFSTGSERSRKDFEGLVRANCYRAEEALRVIEEFGKILSPEGADRVKKLRFRLYSIEKQLFSSLSDIRGMPRSPFLYSFIDRGLVGSKDLAEVATDLVEGGSGLIQYRAKGLDLDGMRRDLATILPIAEKSGIPVIVNDHPDIAAETGAGGVHIGTRDPGLIEARAVLGPHRIIGVTVHDREEVGRIDEGEVDYIAVGAVFPSKTKIDVKVCGLEMISEIKSLTGLPLVAIGGINTRNLDSVIEAGADGIAAISAILDGDIRKNCFTLKEIIDKKRDER